MLDISAREKIVETHYYEIDDVYTRRMKPTDNQVFSFEVMKKSINPVVHDIWHFNVTDLFSRIENVLLRNIKCIDLQKEKLYGWSRELILENEMIGVISTAYGLILSAMLKISDHSYLNVRDEIVHTLVGYQLSGGGYSAVSQREYPSIEATVWAARAFYYVGDRKEFETTLHALYKVMEDSRLNDKASITTLTLVMDLFASVSRIAKNWIR